MLEKRYPSPNMYNFKNIVELYAGQEYDYKKIHIQHGVSYTYTIDKTDLYTDAQVMFAWNKRYKELWNKEDERNMPCYILGSPFVHFRHSQNIQQNPNAKGTIVYPTHSIKDIQIQYDIDDYCEKLRKLPEEFQPITICLHYYDIQHHQADEEYIKRGFNVTCALTEPCGPYQYPIGFYRDLRNHKYASANTAGTCAFYAVEMGIPFFLLGEPPISDNSQGIEPNLPKKKNIYDASYTPHVKHFFDLFTHEDKTVITPEQKEYVYSALGINDCISREELCKILKELG